MCPTMTPLQKMGKQLQAVLANSDPERFAFLLSASQDADDMRSSMNEIPPESACDVAARLTPEAARRLLGVTDDATLTGWLEAAATDDARRLVTRLDPERASAVVSAMNHRSKRRALRRLSGYPPGTVGDLAQTRLILVKSDDALEQVDARIQAAGETSDCPVIVTRNDGSVLGVLDLMRYLRGRDQHLTAAETCIAVEPLHAGSSVEALRLPVNWSRLTELPVVDASGKPIGFVSRLALEGARIDRNEASLFSRSLVELARQYWSFLIYTTAWLLERKSKP